MIVSGPALFLLLCVWCNQAIRWDGHADWVHLEGGYPCRDYSTMRQRTYATPPPLPWPPQP